MPVSPQWKRRRPWCHSSPDTCRSRHNMQAWNSDPNASGSRTWPKEEIEQAIDLRVDGITIDETYKDEQYMQRIAEQVHKHVTTKEILKDDSPEDNVLSEQTIKKIHEAGNCELHAIQQRTNKVQCQRCYSYTEAGFQVCPCGGQLNMSEVMLSSIRQKFEQLIADAYLTFQGTRGARHGVHFLAKEFMRNIGSQLQTKYLDERMVRICGLHQNNRYFAQSLSRTIGTIRYVVSFSVQSETNGKRTHTGPWSS